MWTALAILASMVVSAGIGIITQSMQNDSTRETNEANRKINEINNSFNAEQADINRQFQSTEAATDRTFSAEQADINRQFQAEEAQKQRDYETEMSNTAIQRRAADLQSAGFNPLLAITSGSASTPGAVAASGSAAQGSHAAGSQAAASGLMPMRAMDYSPMAMMSQNLSHMVSSAASVMRLKKMAEQNPQAMGYLAKATEGLMRTTTSAQKVDKLMTVADDKELSKLLKTSGMW